MGYADYGYITRGVAGGGRYGVYGKLPGQLPDHTVSQGFRSPGTDLSQSTHMLPAFANEAKRERNIKRTRGVFRTNVSPVFRGPDTPSESGLKLWQTYPSPSVQAWLHLKDRDDYQATAKNARGGWMQTPEMVVQAHRVNANRMHSGLIRPAAPAQVSWKVSYVVGQRYVQPVGPYQSIQQKSIIQRIGDYTNRNK